MTWNAPASMRWSAGRGRVSTRRRRLHAISIARARDPGSVGGGRGGRRPHGGRGRCGSHRRQVGGLRAGQEGPGAGRRGGRSGQTHGHPHRLYRVRRQLTRRGGDQGPRRDHRVPGGLHRLPARGRPHWQGRLRGRHRRGRRGGRRRRRPTGRPRARPERAGPPDPLRAALREHPRGQPVHADRRHRSGPVRPGPPDLGRPRHDGRHRRHRRRPRSPRAADHDHRRAQDRRLGHHDRPDLHRDHQQRRRPDVGPDGHPGRPVRPSPSAGRHVDRPGRRLPVRCVQRARPPARRRARQRRQPRRQPGRLQRDLRACCGTPRPTRSGSTPTRTTPSPTSPAHDRLQGQPGRRATSAPTTRRRRSPSVCRSSCRPTARTRSSTSASSPGDHGSHVAGIVVGQRDVRRGR